MEIIDIVFVTIIVVNGVIAFSRGLIKTLFNFFSSIIAVILSYMFYPVVSQMIITMTSIDEGIQKRVSEGLNVEELAKGVISKQDEINFINNLELPGIIKEQLLSNNNPEVYQVIDVTAIKDYITHMLSQGIINALSFVLLFIVFTILLAIVANVLDLIAKLPVLKQLNKGAGLLVGVIWGVLINWIICVVIFLVGGLGMNIQIMETLEHSMVAKYFYNVNPLIDILSNLV